MLTALCISHGVHAELYRRAPDVYPGTLPEMRTPDYWIARMKNPDAIILNPEEIQARNEAYVTRMSDENRFSDINPDRRPRINAAGSIGGWPGGFILMPDIRPPVKPDTISVIVREKIQEDIDYIHKRSFGNFQAIEYAPRQIEELVHEMALDTVEDEAVIRDAIAVRTTRLRVVPSFFPEQMGIQDNGKPRWDMWTTGLVRIGSHVTVLHSSRMGAYVFVLSGEGYGWVDTRDVAFGDIHEIRVYNESESFIVCTGDRVPFYSDKRCTYISGWLSMGDRIPLYTKDNPRVILVPHREVNGKYLTAPAWLAEDADVSVGWLPYTRRAVVETAFKLLDNPYDWTMGFFGRNHETTYRDIFACFGFRLPYRGSLFTLFGDNDTVVTPDLSREKQYEMILANEPFITLQISSGHAQLLLGEHNGVPIVFDQNGYGYTGEDGTEYELKRCCVVDASMPSYFLKNPISFLELK